jgi:hypothetical protein
LSATDNPTLDFDRVSSWKYVIFRS